MIIFQFWKSAAAPISDFILEHHLACTNQDIQIFDNSFNQPLDWEWTIEPSNFEFVNGTSEHSPNPVVNFASTGTYSITLQTTNNYGTNEVVKYDILLISDGHEIPYVENFNTPIPSLDWQVDNPDHSTGWENISIIGKSGQQTNAAYINNHSYNAVGQEDLLTSRVIDLTNAQNPHLRFDLSYALFNQNYIDALRVELSSNCKESFDVILFNESGTNLATAANQMTGWTPGASEDWKTEIIDLSAYIGQKIALRFVNTCGFGNNLYLDNITVYEHGEYPNAEFSYSPDEAQFCVGELILFENLSDGLNLESFEWEFGNSANPASASTSGPHFVTFNQPGEYEVSLRVANSIGWDQITKVIQIVEEPEAAFSLEVSGTTITCFNESNFGVNYIWDFGDGTISLEEHPQHTYLNSDTYTISLISNNGCGEDIAEQVIGITSVENPVTAFNYTITPNPVNDFLNLQIHHPYTSTIEYSIIEISGKVLLKKELNVYSDVIQESINTQQLPGGMYFVKLTMDNTSYSEKIIVRRM